MQNEQMLSLAERLEAGDEPPLCSDLDEDCPGIEDHLNCWLYDPIKGRCPFLRSRTGDQSNAVQP